jgi:hypothetical protein
MFEAQPTSKTKEFLYFFRENIEKNWMGDCVSDDKVLPFQEDSAA